MLPECLNELEFRGAARYQLATRRRTLGGPTMHRDRSAGKRGGSKIIELE
jgi:hypothetical protein